MQASIGLKTSFKQTDAITSTYTGGKAHLSTPTTLFTTYGDDVLVTDTTTGRVVHRIKGNGDSVTCFAVSPDGSALVVAYQSLGVRVVHIGDDGVEDVRRFKAHEAPVLAMDIDATSTLVATGSADASVMVWDIQGGFCTHRFKGHSGIVSALRFHPDPKRLQLASGSDDCTACLWDLKKSECIASFTSHVSVIRGIGFSKSGQFMYTAARDKVVNKWDIDALALVKTVPVFETLEGIAVVEYSIDGEEGAREGFVTGGDKGLLRLWDAESGEVVTEQDSERTVYVPEHAQSTTSTAGGGGGPSSPAHLIAGILFHAESQTIVSVTSDQNFLFVRVVQSMGGVAFERTRQIAGYNEQVLDMCFVGGFSTTEAEATTVKDVENGALAMDTDAAEQQDGGHLAVVTNTDQIRVYNLETRSCDIIYGHTDTVLSIAATRDGCTMVTGSKDRTAHVWTVDTAQQDSARRYAIVGTCVGHTEPVSAVDVSVTGDGRVVVVTGSQDRTVKIWDVVRRSGKAKKGSKNQDGAEDGGGMSTNSIKARQTVLAHTKDIQTVAISPNAKMFASGSLDRTAKLWSLADGSLLGAFKGHKRGIWCTKFSPVDQVLATASTDKTIKLWNVSDFSCVRTFEGHLNTVLNVCFVSAGMQLVSSGSDGLVKVWTIKDSECVCTLDNHDDRVWALTTDATERRIVSGSADSTITIWTDVTESEKLERDEADAQRVVMEEQVSVYLARGEYHHALAVTLKLGHPVRALSILTALRHANPDPTTSITGSQKVDSFFATLDAETLEQLLLYIRDWNTHSKHVQVTQPLLTHILKSYTPEAIVGLKKCKEIMEGLLPYVERHYVHAGDVLRKCCVVEYTLECMDSVCGE